MPGILPHKRVAPNTKFGSFTFLRYVASRFGNAYGVFRCDLCNDERERVVSHVRTGYAKMCRCEALRLQSRHGHTINGASTATYDAWSSMKKRCLNPGHKSFSRYGGRGVTVCDRWLIFENFLADMGHKPVAMSLDRIDNDSGYSPENCRWATCTEQNNNKSSNTLLEFNGEQRTISQWAELTGVKDCTLSERLRRGWSIEKSLTSPTQKYTRTQAATVPPALMNAD